MLAIVNAFRSVNCRVFKRVYVLQVMISTTTVQICFDTYLPSKP